MAYILIEYSMMIQKASGNDNFIIEKNTVRENYNEITKNGINSLKNLLDNANRHLWRCDPTENIPNVTYDVVTRLLQGYIENEMNLNNGASCFQTCEYYQSTTSKGCFDEEFCTEQPKCSGRIHDCQFVDSVLSVYQSPENSTRRYEYIEYGESKSLGTFSNYWSKLNKVESWNRWIFFECSYCFCLCDEQSPKSDPYFNHRETLSDVNANKVVTGVRFVKRNRIFHLQIQQGELLPRGLINESAVEWKPVENYEIDYLEFTNTGMLADVAQSTIPYIDIQDVASIPPVALAGIGIYYKYRGLNGGFVAPQIISYDLSPHFSLIPN
ncbi:uncharacterized protein LOC132788201 [Drosophila nasuta]|uniref:uncharacterized protein LOC132788201 n=1 Tax=Drosophila nasuta TaxID=42062 RepID=UPI00295F1E7A|nr:uncharacterized protein LOC132788201 [Drosophila nasuta]